MDRMEGEKIEFKERYTEDFKKEVVAFANSFGGKIYVGVSDQGKITGIENYDDTLLQISNMIRDSIKPDVTMFVRYQEKIIEEKRILEIEIQRGTNRPYYISKKGITPSGVYVRQGASSVPATDTMIRMMIKEDDNSVFESMRCLKQELSFEVLKKEWIDSSIDFNNQSIRNFKIINQEQLYTNLGYLVSDQCPFEIKILRYSSNDHRQIQDRQIFGGSIFQSMHQTYHYLEGINQLSSTFDGIKRIDHYNYPIQAIREALLNCIVHRDYSMEGSIQITVFEDKIEFTSLGGLVEGMSVNDIMVGISVCRNENLAKLFYRMNLIEGFGIGLQKIFECYQGEKTPLIEITDHVFKITLYNINYEKNKEIVYYTQNIVCDGSTEYNVVSKYLGEHYTITRSDIEELLHTSQATSNRILRKLLEDDRIIKIGQGKNTKYIKKNRES